MYIRIGSNETQQIVYMSNNMPGVYLSESTPRIYHLLPHDFQTQISHLNLTEVAKEIANCTYPCREPIPPIPRTIPFLPTENNRHLLEQWIHNHFSSAYNMLTPTRKILWSPQFWHTIEHMAHWRKNEIVFNPDKFHFAENEAKFIGFLVTTDGVKLMK